MDGNSVIINGTCAGLLEHYAGLFPRSILDHYQSDTKYFRTYKNTFNKMYADQGIASFYKFNFPMLNSIVLAHIWLFQFYEMYKNSDNYLLGIAYSSMAKIGHDVLMVPGDTIRMINNVSGKDSKHIIKDIYKRQGPLGFVRASPIVLFMNIPTGIIEFGSMGYLLNNYDSNTRNYFIFGGLTGIVSSIVSNPLDILKTNIQLQGSINKYSNKKYVFSRTLLGSCKNTFKQMGVKGLFRGTILRSFQMSLCFGTYEYLNT